MASTKNTKLSFWEKVEVVGNKMPHPILLFCYLALTVIVLSAILAAFGVNAELPSGEVVYVKNLLSLSFLVDMISNIVNNLANFRIMATVICLSVASGLCEKTGFFKTVIQMLLKKVNGNGVVYVAAFISTLGNMFGDSAFLVMPLIMASLFKGMNRNPIVGLVMGFACVGGGYGTAIVPGGWDLILTPITIEAAHIIAPDFDMTLVSGYYFTIVSTFVIAITAAFITLKFIEPRLGMKFDQAQNEENKEPTEQEYRAARKALLGMGIFFAAIVLLCIPESSVFRSETGSLVIDSPLMKSLAGLVILAFVIPGLIYFCATREKPTIQELADILNECVKGVAPFIMLAIIIAQFLYYFAASNIGAALAIIGGDFLKSLPLPALIICILFMLLVSLINIFIVSGSAKYLIFGPIFVPMLMQMGIHPAFTQILYRMGDAMTNHLSPLNAFFIIILTLIQKYDSRIKMGTVISLMLPYTVGFMIACIALISIWMLLGLTPGVGSSIFL